MSTKDRAYMRWTPGEWLKVATLATGLLNDHGVTSVDEAIKQAQRAVLPKHRWRDAKSIHNQILSGAWRDYRKRIDAMSAEQRENILLKEITSPASSGTAQAVQVEAEQPPAPTPTRKRRVIKTGHFTPSYVTDLAPPPEAGRLVRWTRREWTLIARGVKWVQEHRAEDLPRLWQQILYAQSFCLDRDRQRPLDSIRQSGVSKEAAATQKRVDEGMARLWEVNSIPFTPPGSESEPEATAEPTPDAAPAAQAEPVEAPTSAPPPAAATPAPPMPRSSLAEAAQAFGETIMGALDKLLLTHTHLMMEQVNERIAASAGEIGAQVGAMIEGNLRRTIVEILGGPAPTPAAPQPPLPQAPKSDGVDIDAAHHQRKRLRVDVVGEINAPVKMSIQETFRDDDLELRFIEGGWVRGYHPTPGRHCLLITERIKHQVSHKLKKAGIEPIFVKPTATMISHAIEELQRSAMQ